jgi:N-acetylmuramoyl-L-alanine amidase
MRAIDKIIIHCSATPEGRVTTVEDIRRWHKERGFSDIGYHYVVCLDGSVHKGRLLEQQGAHCLGQNKNSIGVCYIGGVSKTGKSMDTRTKEQKEALKSLVESLKTQYPESVVYGHKDFTNTKDCPCFNAYEEYN